jgi:DNA-binding MarR family transcriptional regulator
LDDCGPARISALAAAGGVGQPSMTELVGRLEREVLVARFADPRDGRATLVDITASGRRQRRHLRRSFRGRVIELLEALAVEDRATLNLTMRAASPHINLLTELAVHHPSSFGDRTPSTS